MEVQVVDSNRNQVEVTSSTTCVDESLLEYSKKIHSSDHGDGDDAAQTFSPVNNLNSASSGSDIGNGSGEAYINCNNSGNSSINRSNNCTEEEKYNPNWDLIKEKGHFSNQRRIVKGRRLVYYNEYSCDLLSVAPETKNTSSTRNQYYQHEQQQRQQPQSSSATNRTQNLSRTTNRAVRRVQIASKRAALASKRKIWDSNDASIDAAQSAVDKWEASYQTFRSFLINVSKSAVQIYNTTKSASQKIENGLLLPIRDVILLPTFNGIEKATDTTIGFIQSDEAKHVALQSLEVIKTHTPFGIGKNIIAPCLMSSFDILKNSWEIAKYPIPSKADVRYSVDTIMTGTKWFLTTSSREIYFYAKLVDATVTRTLSHTQWRVLNSGPYSTLNSTHKKEVINHLCERYFSLTDDRIARYELTAHIKFYNPSLYHDLVATGLLLERGGELTTNDTWLKAYPDHRAQMIGEDDNILLFQQKQKSPSKIDNDVLNPKPLWFYQPTQNGKKPKKDIPWVRFNDIEQIKIEDGFISFLDKAMEADDDATCKSEEVDSTPSTTTVDKENEEASRVETLNNKDDQDESYHHPPTDHSNSFLPFNVSHWYQPNLDHDILIEQKRQAILFLPHYPQHKSAYPDNDTKRPEETFMSKKSFGSYCKSIVPYSLTQLPHDEMTEFSNLAFPLKILMRPTLWRFHGQGDVVRRGVWLMDTKRHGLQPYSDESAAILEEAYLFLKWSKNSSQDQAKISKGGGKSGIESVLLTVQVVGPDGEETQLVQFRSLSQITAIQKTIAGGFSLFKRRVYRGVQMKQEKNEDDGDEYQNEQTATIKSQDLLAAPWSLHQSVKSSLGDSSVKDNPTADHLVLVVHGIGEMLRSSDVFGMSLPPMTSTIVDCCSSLRKNHAEVLGMHNQRMPQGKSSFGNVEFLPVEWHESFALRSRWSPVQRKVNDSQSTKDAVTLKDISLNTIPHMREFANDTMLDILFFMSPMHHDIMINIVCTEMNTIVQKYKELTGFKGEVSILAHSLGSVIAWDILSQDTNALKFPRNQGIPTQSTSLNFQVVNTFMIGSPVSVFLMLRNQHEPIPTDFYLPGCRRVYNVFHPYDPVAYRIEPLVAKENSYAEPEIISHWRGGFRLQYQSKFLWRRIIDEVRVTQKNVVRAVEAGIEGILDQSPDDLSDDEIEEASLMSDDSCFQIVQVGNVCAGNRLDYMLQEKEIENANEYLSALAAHSSYWKERDLSLFMIQKIYEKEDGSYDISEVKTNFSNP